MAPRVISLPRSTSSLSDRSGCEALGLCKALQSLLLCFQAKGGASLLRSGDANVADQGFALVSCHPVETLRTRGAWLEVGDERFNSSEIQRLYEADDYPLRKPD